MRIRPYTPADAPALFALFHAAVHRGAAARYTRAQRAAWAPTDRMPEGWPARLAALTTRVAQDEIGQPLGFMAMNEHGYLDLAYTHPARTRQGVASAVLAALTAHARGAGLTRLTTHASLVAQPFFARHGWQVDHAERVDRGGEMLDRFAMSFTLAPQP